MNFVNTNNPAFVGIDETPVNAISLGVSNVYGNASVFNHEGKYYIAVESYSTALNAKEISKELYNMLLKELT